MTQFTDLGLAAPILKALATEGYEKPTPIQAQAIPHVMAGRDLLGIAQTGTGKTAAFALPMLHRLAADKRTPARNSCRALILSPTRELASQIADSFRTYGRHLGFRVAVVFGGVGHRPQEELLARGLDILVATPGRLIDHIDSRVLRLDKTEIFVLDEADQMLDMGFIHSIRKIVPQLPKQRQSLFFSATMPKEIGALAGDLLTNPAQVAVTPVATTAERVDQRVLFVETARKRNLLAEIFQGEAMGRTLVFTRTKHGADKVVRHLEAEGIASNAIHGNKSQAQRERALAAFRSGQTPILVATDIAARGIDVDGVTHVINFDLPNIPESYVHRIGRTARAGAEGIAISFCDAEERAYLRDIEKLTRQKIPATDRRTADTIANGEPEPAPKPQQKRGGRGRPGDSRPRQANGQGRPQRADGRSERGPGHGQSSRQEKRQDNRQGTRSQDGRAHDGRAQDSRGQARGELSGVGFLQPARRGDGAARTNGGRRGPGR